MSVNEKRQTPSRSLVHSTTFRSALLIVSLFSCALLAMFLIQSFVASHSGNTVRVADGDGKVYELSLATDDRLEIFATRGKNIIVVENGRVYVEDADCPGKDCVHHVAISNVGESIICLPHHLVVEISAN